jgi:hypothetical protein
MMWFSLACKLCKASLFGCPFHERSFSLSWEIVTAHRGGLLLGMGGELLPREAEELLGQI